MLWFKGGIFRKRIPCLDIQMVVFLSVKLGDMKLSDIKKRPQFDINIKKFLSPIGTASSYPWYLEVLHMVFK